MMTLPPWLTQIWGPRPSGQPPKLDDFGQQLADLLPQVKEPGRYLCQLMATFHASAAERDPGCQDVMWVCCRRERGGNHVQVGFGLDKLLVYAQAQKAIEDDEHQAMAKRQADAGSNDY